MNKSQVQLLKEFCSINTAFCITGTEDISVLSPDKSIMLFYTPKDGEFEEFSTKTRIYNVDYLMALIDTVGIDSKIVVTENTSVSIKNGNKSVKFLQASEGTVPNVPAGIETKFANLEVDIAFTLNKNDIEQIKKISSLLSLSEIKVKASKGKVQLILGGSDVTSSNNFSIGLEGSGEAEMFFDISNFSKMLGDDYEVQASSLGLAKLTAVNNKGLRYYMSSLAKD